MMFFVQNLSTRFSIYTPKFVLALINLDSFEQEIVRNSELYFKSDKPN